MTRKSLHGDCDCCIESKDVDLVERHGDLMCANCVAKEVSAEAQIQAAEQFVADARRQDATITREENIWTASTASFVELGGAIQSNPSIAEDQKRIALVNEAIARIQQMNQAIFETKKTLANQETDRYNWVKRTDELISQLRADQRAQFKGFDKNYEVKDSVVKAKKAAKSPVPASVNGSSSNKPSYKKVKEACDAAGISDTKTISMYLGMNKNMTLEQAIARYKSVVG